MGRTFKTVEEARKAAAKEVQESLEWFQAYGRPVKVKKFQIDVDPILNTSEVAMPKKWIVHLKPFTVEASSWDEALQKAQEHLRSSKVEPEIESISEAEKEKPEAKAKPQPPTPTISMAARKAWIKIWLKRGERAKAEQRAKELGIDIHQVEKEL